MWRTEASANWAVKGGDKVYHRGGGIVYHRHDEEELIGSRARSGQEQGSAVPEFLIESGVVRIIRDLGDSALSATLETVAVAVHLQDVDVVGEAVQQRAGQPLRPEYLGPFVEEKVGGHHDGAPLVALAEDLEEEFRSGGGQGDETQLVDDQQVQTGKLSL